MSYEDLKIEILTKLNEKPLQWTDSHEWIEDHPPLISKRGSQKLSDPIKSHDIDKSDEPVNSPSVGEVTFGMSKEIYSKIISYSGPTSASTDLFDERNYRIGDKTCNLPSPKEIEQVLGSIMTGLKLGVEFAVVTMVYIDMLETAGVSLTPTNWRCIILASFLAATKVWIDENVWNVDFVDYVFPDININDLYRIELEFLTKLGFKLSLQSSTYNHYTDKLIGISKNNSGDFVDNVLDFFVKLKELFTPQSKTCLR